MQTRPTPLLPSLQHLPPDWNGDIHTKPTNNLVEMRPCEHFEINQADSSLCKTYFYKASTIPIAKPPTLAHLRAKSPKEMLSVCKV